MSVPTDLIAQVLELDPNDRVELAHVLLTSVGTEAPISSAEWEAAWMAVIEERVRKLDSGETKAIPAAEVLEEMRQALCSRASS